MNRIARRSTITILLAILLVAGFAFFVAEFIMEADTWVISPGSPHVYNATNIGTGTVIERDGTLLLDMGDVRSYSTSETLRKSTLHWLGDRDGYISAPILANYAAEIAGYDKSVLEEKFGALYNAFQFGAPPHAGMAPGVDRMIMLLRNEENIREVIPFPMSGTAQDLMCGAPNEVTEQQLREVHIKVRQ